MCWTLVQTTNFYDVSTITAQQVGSNGVQATSTLPDSFPSETLTRVVSGFSIEVSPSGMSVLHSEGRQGVRASPQAVQELQAANQGQSIAFKVVNHDANDLPRDLSGAKFACPMNCIVYSTDN